ncbi:PPE family protein [Mycobacterium rhizamassiliense]|uniref:PPE family protein n=2 Tax=Mycobacterium rhizamassiliense TaxID=1841860 RepID=A0A2U3NRL0_9MYCO|nr:PPE family protein [Mycobacterium rhizamassiliense]
MYSGLGSGSLLIAASGWKSLAAELRSAALSYGAVLAALTEEEWHGPASAAMAAAATPFVAWTNATAVQAEQTALQAEAAAAAHETAFGATVPPPQIAANRTRLAVLKAGNLLGQNTPAIAATEAQYGEMWAQDAAAMYGYAASSAVAAELAPIGTPQEIVATAGVAEQMAAVDRVAAESAGAGRETLSQLTATVPRELRSLASPSSSMESGGWNPFAPGSAGDTTGINGVFNAMFGPDTAFGQFVNANIWNTIFGSGFYLPSNFLGTGADFIGLSQAAAPAAESAAATAAAAGAGEAAAAAGNAISAELGKGALVGPLSVPPSWTATGPLSPLFPALGATRMIAPPPVVAAGMPGPGMSGQGYGGGPRYGFRPTVVARPPAAG